MSRWASPQIAEVALDDVCLDPRAQMRPDEDFDEDYIDHLATIAPHFRDRIVVFQEKRIHWCADGFQRWYATKRAGLKTIMADVYPGELRDAIRYALSANATHGRQRSPAALQRVFEAIVMDPEWGKMTDGEIADLAGVHRHTAAKYLASCRSGQDRPDTRIVTRGSSSYEMDVSRLTKNVDDMSEVERVKYRQQIEGEANERAASACRHRWVCADCGRPK